MRLRSVTHALAALAVPACLLAIASLAAAPLRVCAYLPPTVWPAGPSRDDPAIGVRIIGPQFGGLRTIGRREAG